MWIDNLFGFLNNYETSLVIASKLFVFVWKIASHTTVFFLSSSNIEISANIFSFKFSNKSCYLLLTKYFSWIFNLDLLEMFSSFYWQILHCNTRSFQCTSFPNASRVFNLMQCKERKTFTKSQWQGKFTFDVIFYF